MQNRTYAGAEKYDPESSELRHGVHEGAMIKACLEAAHSVRDALECSRV